MKQIMQSLIESRAATPEQVRTVIGLLLSGNLDPAFAGAFLSLQMRNGIDGQQLAAALEIMMDHATTVRIRDGEALDNCGTGGDGGHSFNVSTTAAFAIAAAGHTVAKHGNRSVSSSCGSADLLEALGLRLDLSPMQVAACIDEVGIGFMFAPVFHPAMRYAAPIRKSLGVRTLFNLLGPLANPARVPFQLIGVFEESLTQTFAEALAAMGKTGLVVHGEDGSDEVSLTTPTQVTEVRDGQISSTVFDPRSHGFQLVKADQLEGGTLPKNRTIFEAVLAEGREGPALDLVVLNAGFAMYATGRYGNLDQTFSKARAAIASGKAWAKVQALIAWAADAAPSDP